MQLSFTQGQSLKCFKISLFKIFPTITKKIEENSSKVVYNVWREDYERSVRIVTFDSSNITVKCSCQLFEFAGYLCRHVLKIFLVEDVHKLPTHYVIKRWMDRDAKLGSVIDAHGEEMQADCHETVTIRYSKLCQEAVNIAAKGSTSKDIYLVAIQILQNARKEVEAAYKQMSVGSNKDSVEEAKVTKIQEYTEIHSHNQKPLVDPLVAKHKGRKKRITSCMDKPPKKKRSPNSKTSKRSKVFSSSTRALPHDGPIEQEIGGQGLQDSPIRIDDQLETLEQPIKCQKLEELGRSHQYRPSNLTNFEFASLSE
ncbi:hypothetical protein IFM89_007115, partial [Coptis chinensis]